MNNERYNNTTIVRSESLNNYCETPTATYINKKIFNLWYHEEFEAYHITTEHNSDNKKLLAFSVDNSRLMPEVCKFDTDAYLIGADSYAFCCISPYIRDFVKGYLGILPTSKKVRPFGKGNSLNITMIRTLVWRFQENEGRIHKFKIKDAILVPDGTMRLLSP